MTLSGISVVLLLGGVAANASGQEAADTHYIVKVKWNYGGSSMSVPMTDKVGPFATHAAADSAMAEIVRTGCWPLKGKADERYCSKNIFSIKIEPQKPKQ